MFRSSTSAGGIMNEDQNEKKTSDPVSENKNRASLSIYLIWSVFITGAGVMAAEMAAPRLLAPSFGTSQLIWTNIIGTVLAALTLGAFAGGRLADRWPTEKAYAAVLVISGFTLALIPFSASPFLRWAATALEELKIGLFLISLLAVSLFFAPPIFLLGMLGPWAVRIAGAGRSDLGSVAGILSALSALGSIAGTFLTSLVILPLFGTRATLLATAAIIAATGAWKLITSMAYSEDPAEPREFRSIIFNAIIILTLAALVIAPLFFKDAFGPVKTTKGQIFETESAYQYIEVLKTRSGEKLLLLNEGIAQHSVLPSRGYLTGGYWDHISVIPSMTTNSGDQLKVLILGLAGGTMARGLDHYYGETRKLSIDGVEIDPDVIEAGNRFFDLKNVPTLTTHAADARLFLHSTRSTYDLIVADAFRQPYIPFHMVTREFYRTCLQHLSKKGVFVINLGVEKGNKDLVDAFTATLRSIFPFVHSFVLKNEFFFDNHIYIGSNFDITLENAASSIRNELDIPLAEITASWREPSAGPGSFIFTDDHSPIELFVERMILQGTFTN